MLSAFTFLGGPGLAYARGAAVFYLLGYGVLGAALLFVVGPRIAELGKSRGYLTQAQLVAGRFPSPLLATLLGIVAVLVPVPYLGLQMISAGVIAETLTGGAIPLAVGAAACFATVAAYAALGGVAALARASIWQGILKLVVACGVGWYIPTVLTGGVRRTLGELAASRPDFLVLPGIGPDGVPWSWGAYTSASLSGAVAFSVWPHVFMLMFAADGPRVVRRALAWFPAYQLILIPVMLAGLAGALWPTPPPRADAVLLHLVLESGAPAVLVGLVCAAALAAAMSTGQALIHCASTAAVEDLLAPRLGLDDAQRCRLIRALTLLFVAAVFYLTVIAGLPVTGPVIAAYAMVSQIAPPVYAALLWRRATTAGVVAGIVGGLLTSVALILLPRLSPPGLIPPGLDAGLIGLGVNVALLVAVSFATTPQDERHLAGFGLAPTTAKVGGREVAP